MQILKDPEPGERGYKKFMRAQRNQWATIYFIEAVGLGVVKIGYTLSMDQRLTTLLSVCPVPLRVLGELTGGPEKETEIHALFDASRSHGEWFHRTPELDAYIAEHGRESPWAGVVRSAGRRLPPNPMSRAAVRAKAAVADFS